MNQLSVGVILICLACPLSTLAKNNINIVGSSTVYPFSTTVAELFAQSTNGKAPKVEATGSGGGMKLFCNGDDNAPSITNSSRRIKKSEQNLCRENGVENVLEVKIGYDGIVIAQSVRAIPIALSRQQLFLALGRDVPDQNGSLVSNPYKNWSDVDPSLPNVMIKVYGPPPTSGTRDSFAELVMEQGGCDSFPTIKTIKKTDKKKYQAICHGIREDGVFIESGENDNLIIQRLVANPESLGIFGYSFLEANQDKVKGVPIENVRVNFDTIAEGDYPISRALFFYANIDHYDRVKNLREFVQFFASIDVMGTEGVLTDRGLIPLPNKEYEDMVNRIDRQTILPPL